MEPGELTDAAESTDDVVPDPLPAATTFGDAWRRRPTLIRVLMGVIVYLVVWAIVALVVRSTGKLSYHHDPLLEVRIRLRHLLAMQDQFTASRYLERTSDGAGLPGTFLEMAGAVVGDGRARVVEPPVLSGVYRSLDVDGDHLEDGWKFRIYLSRADGTALASGESLRIDDASTEWCVYAWPEERWPGPEWKTFFLHSSGTVLSSEDADYEGALAPTVEAAFASGGVGRFGELTTGGGEGQDGSTWVYEDWFERDR